MTTDTAPEPSILERMLIPRERLGPPAQACIITPAHTYQGARTFDVTGIPICEDCIRDIVNVVTAIAAALEGEETP